MITLRGSADTGPAPFSVTLVEPILGTGHSADVTQRALAGQSAGIRAVASVSVPSQETARTTRAPSLTAEDLEQGRLPVEQHLAVRTTPAAGEGRHPPLVSRSPEGAGDAAGTSRRPSASAAQQPAYVATEAVRAQA